MCEQIRHGQGCPFLDVAHPAFPLPTTAVAVDCVFNMKKIQPSSFQCRYLFSPSLSRLILMHAHRHARTHTHTHTHVRTTHAHTRAHTHTHAHRRTHTQIHTHSLTHRHRHRHTHSETDRHTRTHTQRARLRACTRRVNRMYPIFKNGDSRHANSEESKKTSENEALKKRQYRPYGRRVFQVDVASKMSKGSTCHIRLIFFSSRASTSAPLVVLCVRVYIVM